MAGSLRVIRMRQLTAFQRDIMFALSKLNEPKGLDVKEYLESYYSEEIRHGRLYPNLDTLVEQGLVNKGQHDRRTNKYTLTDEGATELQDRLEWELTDLPQEFRVAAESIDV